MDPFASIKLNDYKSFCDYIQSGGNVNITKKGYSLLYKTIKYDRLDMFKLLLDCNVDIELHDPFRVTPLDFACNKGNSVMVIYLLGKEANVNCRDIHNWTPLHTAVSKGHHSIIKILILNGADLEAEDDDGETPLNLCYSSNIKNMFETSKLLISLGADVNHENYAHESFKSKLFKFNAPKCVELKSILS
jgi:ankyrin repeat protein